jgi:amino acid transporter
MSEDRLFFHKVGAVHPRYGTPYVAVAVSATLGIVFVLLRTFEQLSDTFVTAIVPFYALGVAAVFVMRRRANYDPPFRVPLYPVVPALFVLATICLLANALINPDSRWATAAVLGTVALGAPVYFVTVGRTRAGGDPGAGSAAR